MPTINDPKISIVMPVLNGGKTIEKAIQSILRQNYSNIELIIIDGMSTDNTIEIIKKYEKHVSYWHSKHDGNPQIAINAGTMHASGDLVVQLMSDDFYETNTLRNVADAYLAHPDADIISCGGRVVGQDSKGQYRVKQSYSTQDELELNFQNICFGVSAICVRFIRKSLFERIGYYLQSDEQGKILHSADKEFLLRAIVNNAKHVSINHIGHNYLAHEDSTTYSNNRSMTVRLYHEHMHFAELYLKNASLTDQQKSVLHHWYYHQSARLAFYRLYKKQIHNALTIIKNDLPRYHLKWIYSFITAAPDFFCRKTWQAIKNLFNQYSGKNIIYGNFQ